MDKRSEAAAMAGWSENPNAPIDQRLVAAKQALDYYVGQADALEEFHQYCEEMIRKDEGCYHVWAEVAAKLEEISGGE